MRILIVSGVCIAMAFQAIAHNAKIATYTLRDTGIGWFIEMNFAYATVDAGMVAYYGEERTRSMSEDEYKKRFADYIQAHFDLNVDSKVIPLKNGGIRVGSHQVDVKFVLPEIPVEPKHLSIHLPMFNSSYNHTNLFRIYQGGDNVNKFFLNADNDFKAGMKFTEKGIVEVSYQEPFPGILSHYLIMPFLIVIIVLGVFYRRICKNRLPERSPTSL